MGNVSVGYIGKVGIGHMGKVSVGNLEKVSVGYMVEVNIGHRMEGIYVDLRYASLDNKCENVESKYRDL